MNIIPSPPASKMNRALPQGVIVGLKEWRGRVLAYQVRDADGVELMVDAGEGEI